MSFSVRANGAECNQPETKRVNELYGTDEARKSFALRTLFVPRLISMYIDLFARRPIKYK